MNKKHIYLLGFMGSGKSYWGKKLSALLDMPWIDLDEYIERKNGLTIAQIFETRGAAKFRYLEQAALQETIKMPPSIISLGGGTPCFFDNMAIINQNGFSFYLKTSNELLAERLLPEMNHRPLLKNFSKEELILYIGKKLKERKQFYETANVEIDTSQDLMSQFHHHLNILF